MGAPVDAGDEGQDTEDGDEPEQPLFIAQLLQVKAGWIAKQNVCPRQEETDAQAQGAQIGQLCAD